MVTATIEVQEFSRRAWYIGLARVNGGIARILLAIEIGAQMAFQSMGVLGRCYV